MDVNRIKNCFKKAQKSYNENAIAQKQICEKLASLLPNKEFIEVLEIGCGTGNLTQLLNKNFKTKNWTINDLCTDFSGNIQKILPNKKIEFLFGDVEKINFAKKYDLIASASTFQWLQNIQSLLHNLSDKLESHGILLFSSFLPKNLYEIAFLTGKKLDYLSAIQLKEILEENFKVKTFHEEEIILEFNDAESVLRHLKYSGVNATERTIWTRGKVTEFAQRYQQNFMNKNGKLLLTYNPVYVLAYKKEKK